MLLEASTLLDGPIFDQAGTRLGTVAHLVFDGEPLRLAGFGVDRPGLLTKTVALPFLDVRALNQTAVSVTDSGVFLASTKPFDALAQRYGSILHITAQTESGQRLGRIADVLLEAETGLVVRFYLRHFWHERIIPRSFLVSCSPQAVVFQDITGRPVFNQVASQVAHR